MIYLIGGPARVGKSTLARRVRKEIDGQVLAGDAFVHALQENLRAEWLPDIFDHIAASVVAMEDPKAVIARLRRRDETMWQFYQAYITNFSTRQVMTFCLMATCGRIIWNHLAMRTARYF